MVTFGEFERERPDLASAARQLLYQFGVGLGFLASVRRDGGPRLHPMCPLLTDEGLFAFIIPSPKQHDLERDGRYALHSFPCDDNEDAFYASGRVRLVSEDRVRQELTTQFVAERPDASPPGAAQLLFELLLERCLITRTTGHGDPDPVHTIWPI